MTYLTVPITAKTMESARASLSRAVAGGAEMIELRLDYQTDLSEESVGALVRHARSTGLVVIATCRTTAEGGLFSGSDRELISILSAAMAYGADFIDIEYKKLCEDAYAGWRGFYALAQDRAIVSYHDFSGPIPDFEALLSGINGRGSAVSKVVYTAGTINDCFTAMDALHRGEGGQLGLIALAMGPSGVLSRLTTKKLGGFLSFVSVDESQASAPGQVTLESAGGLYRWRAIEPKTGLYGVIGYPIGHSLSPAIHNAAFDATGINGLYLPLLVDPKREVFEEFMNHILSRPWLDFQGLSITMPHKEHALDYIRSRGGVIEPLAGKIQAVNTLVITEDGVLHGYNTDYAAALDAVADRLGIGWDGFKGMRAAIVGAGGVARSLAAGLTDGGASVTIYNRTQAKAARLAAEFGCRAEGLEALATLEAELIVNCTSIGMYPETDQSAVPETALRAGIAVFDTVYNPVETKLLAQARQRGCVTVDGVSMFVNQAARQFELFTERTAPRELMERIVLDRLKKG